MATPTDNAHKPWSNEEIDLYHQLWRKRGQQNATEICERYNAAASERKLPTRTAKACEHMRASNRHRFAVTKTWSQEEMEALRIFANAREQVRKDGRSVMWDVVATLMKQEASKMENNWPLRSLQAYKTMGKNVLGQNVRSAPRLDDTAARKKARISKNWEEDE